jgi:hypothetical protein
MTPRKLAQNYLRYWDADHPAMNAPIELLRFVQTLNPAERRNMRAALQSVADGEAATILPDEQLLAWLAANPIYASLGDAILEDRKAPKTMTTLLRNIYASSQRQLRARALTWLQAELEKFQS